MVGNTEMDLEERVWDIVDWIDLAEDSDIRRAFASTVMKIGFLKVWGIFGFKELLPSQESLCSKEL